MFCIEKERERKRERAGVEREKGGVERARERGLSFLVEKEEAGGSVESERKRERTRERERGGVETE